MKRTGASDGARICICQSSRQERLKQLACRWWSDKGRAKFSRPTTTHFHRHQLQARVSLEVNSAEADRDPTRCRSSSLHGAEKGHTRLSFWALRYHRDIIMNQTSIAQLLASTRQ